MTEYSNENRWTLFRNTRKASDTHADYNGSLNINGVEYWLNGWIREGKNGKFFSGTVKPKQPQSASGEYEAECKADARQANTIARGSVKDDEDFVPF